MHLQTSVPDWPTALIKMPDYTLAKAVNDPSLLTDGLNRWTAAGRDPKKLFLDYRYHDQDYTFTMDFEQMKEKWRHNFFRFIDGTYLNNHAPYIKFVEEHNEYTDNRMITDPGLKLPRLTSARAAVEVWNVEFRGRVVHSPDGGEGAIPADARLVICNGPVGNHIPKEWFQLSVAEDAPLGYHPYTYWSTDPGHSPIRAANDWVDYSGRWEVMEQQYGIKPDWVFTENGPFQGTWSGWRHPNCLGGSLDKLVEAMREWVLDCQDTAAYQEGRIIGPGAWFTCNTNDGDWTYFKLFTPELTLLANMMTQYWKPGTPPNPPDPDPDCVGLPRINYHRVYNVVRQNSTRERAIEIFSEAWDRGKETVGGSYDDAGIGDLSVITARLYDVPYTERDILLRWFEQWYPHVAEILFSGGFKLTHWPIQGSVITQRFGINPQDYIQFGLPGHDGVDIDLVTGDEVRAAAPGEVYRVHLLTDGPHNYGNHVRLLHVDGYKTIYCHLTPEIPPDINVGTIVQGGDLLGLGDNSGNSHGSHLHFGMKKAPGDPGWPFDLINPEPFLFPLKGIPL